MHREKKKIQATFIPPFPFFSLLLHHHHIFLLPVYSPLSPPFFCPLPPITLVSVRADLILTLLFLSSPCFLYSSFPSFSPFFYPSPSIPSPPQPSPSTPSPPPPSPMAIRVQLVLVSRQVVNEASCGLASWVQWGRGRGGGGDKGFISVQAVA